MDWYPHDIADYNNDTLHLSAEQDGIYIRLIRWYYREERPLPDDDAKLAGIAHVTLEKWLEHAAVIRAFFVTRDTTNSHPLVLHHKRCDEVILTQSKRRRDWNKRQKKLRKHNILRDVTRDTSVSNAPRGEERNIDIDTNVSISSSPASPSMSFDEFWKVYPRKEGKQAAEREFKRQRAKLPPAAELKASIERYIANKKPDIDYCHPRNWLSQGRWLDEISDKTPAPVETKFELPKDAPQWRKNILGQIGGAKYKNWVVATELRTAENKGHFYVKSNFCATYLASNLLKEIALAVGCEEREIIFHVRPQKETSK